MAMSFVLGVSREAAILNLVEEDSASVKSAGAKATEVPAPVLVRVGATGDGMVKASDVDANNDRTIAHEIFILGGVSLPGSPFCENVDKHGGKGVRTKRSLLL